jgi:hypothetical protein
MDENEAIKLLDKLKKFIEDTNSSIISLQNRVYNLGVEIEKIKKEKKIIITN